MSESHLHNSPDLYQRVASGDESAFRDLFKLYVPRLQAMIIRITRSSVVADDLIQETFLKIWIARDQLAIVEQPGAWIMKIGFFQAVNYIRRQTVSRKIMQEVQYGYQSANQLNNTGNPGDFQRMLEFLHKAVLELPPKQKMVYQLSRDTGLSIAEIAVEMNLAISTVKNLMVMALKHIRDNMKNAGYFPLLFLFLSFS